MPTAYEYASAATRLGRLRDDLAAQARTIAEIDVVAFAPGSALAEQYGTEPAQLADSARSLAAHLDALATRCEVRSRVCADYDREVHDWYQRSGAEPGRPPFPSPPQPWAEASLVGHFTLSPWS